MNFGNSVDTLSSTATNSTATLAYTCSGGTPGQRLLICAHLGDGSTPAAGGYRRMSGANSYLSYQLYQTVDRTVVWGSGGSSYTPPPIAVILDGNGAQSGQEAIYGRLFGSQPTAEAAAYVSSFAGQVDVRYRATQDNDCTGIIGTSAAPTAFDVKATVVEHCLVETQPVNFGAHGVLRSNIDSTGMVSVICTPATDYTIRLNGGDAGTAPTARQMSKNARSITYGLYRNGARDQPWGDTSGDIITGAGNGSYQQHVVYGRVPAQATPPPGTYVDTVIVTVDY